MPGGVERAEIWAKKRRALEMRLVKHSYHSIADELGINVATAHAWIKELTATHLPPDDMDDLRAHEAAAYDASEQRLLSVMDMVKAQAMRKLEDTQGLGDVSHELSRIESLERTLMDVRKQRAILLGINRPAMVQHNVTIRTVLDEELELLVSELSGGGNVMSDPAEAKLVEAD